MLAESGNLAGQQNGWPQNKPLPPSSLKLSPSSSCASSSSSGCGSEEPEAMAPKKTAEAVSSSSAHFLESLAEPVARYLTLASSALGAANGLKSAGQEQTNESMAETPTNEGEEAKGMLVKVPKRLVVAERSGSNIEPAPVSPILAQQPTFSMTGKRPLSRAALSRAKFAIRSYTIAAAMPRRSRSLVDDARMETQRNKALLDEIRSEQLERQESLQAAASAGAEVLAEQPELEKSEGEEPGVKGTEDAMKKKKQQQQQQQQQQQEPEVVLDEAQEIERCLVEFPRHISELDHCNHLLIKYEPELDPTHPGFHDLEYRARRKEVAEVAFNYRHGERIPEIAYSHKEQQTWKVIYLRLKEAYKRYACEQHNSVICQLEEAGIYSAERVPQLQAVSEFLERKSGWRLRPVAGLLSARDFLASLAFRVFQTTQYIRHWANPEHSVEPDCIHELMGHIPMLCDPEFAHFSQELGLASLGASDEQIERFATLYWFTVEFGLCQEAGQLKCYGAGLLSSYGEMEHALESGKPKLKEFVPEETALEVYDDSEYQVVYYVARSFEEAKAKIKLYAAKHLKRDFELAYDPYTCSIVELKSYAELESYAASIRNDLTRLTAAIGKLKAAA